MSLDLIFLLPFYIFGGVLVIFYLFIDRTPKHRVAIFILMVLWALSTAAEEMFIITEYLSTIFIGLAAVVYILRFKNFMPNSILEWIKISLVITFVIVEAADNDLLFATISSLLISIYVIDKTTFNLELSNNWKMILITPFLLSIVSGALSYEIQYEEHDELFDRYREEMVKREKLQVELAQCEVDKRRLEIEKFKQPNKENE